MTILGDAIVATANLVVILLALIVFMGKKEILQASGPKTRRFLGQVFSRFKIDRISWANVGISIAILFFLDFTIMTLTDTTWIPEENFISPGFILSSLIAPIGEEFLFRGLIFGVFCLLIIPMALSPVKKGLDKNKFYIGFFLVLQAFFFTIFHDNPHIINFAIRFLGAIIYGLLYVLNNYNLLPAILTHLAHNLFINSGIYQELGRF